MEKTETNPFFKSKYFDINNLLAQLKPLLEKHQLCIIQPVCEGITGRPTLMTEVWDLEKKESIMKSYAPLPDIQDPQKMGSAITYYRRYSLQSLFLLQTVDDDGEGAKETKKVGKTASYQAKTKADYENNVDPLQNNEDEI